MLIQPNNKPKHKLRAHSIFIFLLFILLTGCKRENSLSEDAMLIQLDSIEEILYFYPIMAENTLDSLNNHYSIPSNEKYRGQLAYLNGLLAFYKGEIDSSLAFIDISYVNFVEQKDPIGQGKCQLLLAWIAEKSNYWEQAKIHYYQSIELMDNVSCMETGWAYLGLFRCKTFLNEQVGDELQVGKEIMYETGEIECTLYAEQMDCFAKFRAPDVTERLNTVASKYLELGLNNKAGSAYKILAKHFVYVNQFDSAGFYIDKSLQYLNSNYPGTSLIPAANQFKASVYFYKKDYQNARLYCNKAIELYDEYGRKINKYHALRLLHRIDKVNGDYVAAYKHILEEKKIYDQTRKREKQRMAQIAEVDANVSGIKEELAQVAYSKRVNTLSLSCVVLFVLLVFVLVYFRFKINERKLREKQQIMSSLLLGLGEKRHLLKRLRLKTDDLPTVPIDSIDSPESFDQCFTETILHFGQKFSELSQQELRYAVMIGMGIPNTIIAEINSVQPNTIRKVKQRIRNKIQLDTSCNLEEYFGKRIAM